MTFCKEGIWIWNTSSTWEEGRRWPWQESVSSTSGWEGLVASLETFLWGNQAGTLSTWDQGSETWAYHILEREISYPEILTPTSFLTEFWT